MSTQLDVLERDVAQARRRVQEDLANLRGPAAGRLKSDLTATAENVLTDIKDRLAANPVATLAIGAGVAWQLVRRPPVASVLVGYGLYSLMHTDPRQPTPMNAYAMQALDRGQAMAEQATRLAGDVRSAAADRFEAAKQTAAQATAQAAQATVQAADAVRSTASQWTDRATQAANDASAAITQGAAIASDRASRFAETAQVTARRDKDTYLLGFAAAALAAAIGISAQRRMS
jgi:hypothetical protein